MALELLVRERVVGKLGSDRIERRDHLDAMAGHVEVGVPNGLLDPGSAELDITAGTEAALHAAAQRLDRLNSAHGGRVEELDARPRRAGRAERRADRFGMQRPAEVAGRSPRCEGISAWR